MQAAQRLFELFAQADRPLHLHGDGVAVEIRVGDGHKQAVHQLPIGLRKLRRTELTLDHDVRDAFEGIDQQILELGDLLGFPAYAAHLAAVPSGRFLTLITKHAHTINPLILPQV